MFLTRNGVAKLGDMNVSKVVRKESMCERKLVLLTMPVLKFGEMNPMMPNLIFGHLDAFYTSS